MLRVDGPLSPMLCLVVAASNAAPTMAKIINEKPEGALGVDANKTPSSLLKANTGQQTCRL